MNTNGKTTGRFDWIAEATPSKVDQKFDSLSYEAVFRIPKTKLGRITPDRIRTKLRTFTMEQIKDCAERAWAPTIREIASSLLESDPAILQHREDARQRILTMKLNFREVVILLHDAKEDRVILALHKIMHEKACAALAEMTRPQLETIQKNGYGDWPKSDVEYVLLNRPKGSVSSGRDDWRDHRVETHAP